MICGRGSTAKSGTQLFTDILVSVTELFKRSFRLMHGLLQILCVRTLRVIGVTASMEMHTGIRISKSHALASREGNERNRCEHKACQPLLSAKTNTYWPLLNFPGALRPEVEICVPGLLTHIPTVGCLKTFWSSARGS